MVWKPSVLIVAILSLGCLFVPCDSSSAEEPVPDTLIDYGNGRTEWISTVSSATVSDTLSASLIAAGHTYTVSGSDVIVDSVGKKTIGAAGTGSYSVSGSTGITVSSAWYVYSWTGSEWSVVADISATYANQCLAVGFYPAGFVPAETPDYKAAWTAIGGDSWNTLQQTAELPTGAGKVVWSDDPKTVSGGVYGAILYARGHMLVNYGRSLDGDELGTLISFNVETGAREWSFQYPLGDSMTTSAPVVAGQYIFVQSPSNLIYRIDWRDGPGVNNANVITLNGAAWDAGTPFPQSTSSDVVGGYAVGPSAMVFDSGCIYLKASGGMIYCFDSSLRLVWSYQTNGRGYYTPVTVYGDIVAAGMMDGGLYILNAADGSLIDKKVVYTRSYSSQMIGCVNTPLVIEDGGKTYIMATYNDGRGMNTTKYGAVIFELSGGSLILKKDLFEELGAVSNRITMAKDFKGAYINCDKGTLTLDINGNHSILSDFTSGVNASHSGSVLVNNTYLFSTSYSSQLILQMKTDGTPIGTFTSPIRNYCMISPAIVDGYVLCGNDEGIYVVQGEFDAYVPPSNNTEQSPLMKILLPLIIIIAAIGALWAIMKFGLKWDSPWKHIKESVYVYFYGENYTHNRRSKHRLWAVLAIGIIITFLLALASLCIGSETTLGPGEALSKAWSAIGKGGRHLSYEESLIYNSRLPRTIVAFAVGIGLSTAGAVYQAVIKNPLVEPYIMGVSSGAGTFAVYVIAFNFTFFGLMSAHSPYLTAMAAIVGGLLAFGLTMFLAEKTGGKSMNYVLAGIVIGLVFSAVQSLMMISSGNNIASALTWLYGSFSQVTWEKVWLVLIPALALSFVPYIWAKELNLILIGEDQARQMGLDAQKFDRIMLILASVLTAICVAFVGIIGFVGLVVPHLCRMILGGDHRLMLPASMAFGGALMLAADLLSRTLLTGYELPVGAITTVIGVPVFAYLLIKRGRSYDS